MEPEELESASPPLAETECEVLGENEIDITDELGRRKNIKRETEKDGGKMRMRKWFADTLFDGVLVYGTQKNIEVLLTDDEHKEMRFTRGGVLMQDQFAQLVLNKSCLGWQKSDEVYLCLEKDAKKVTHRTSGNLLACISTKTWLAKIEQAKRGTQQALSTSTDAPNTDSPFLAPVQPPPAKRVKCEPGEPAGKEESENFHVIALIRHERTSSGERVFLVNDQERIFSTLYKSPDIEAYIAADNKWVSTFGAAQFVNVCYTNRHLSKQKLFRIVPVFTPFFSPSFLFFTTPSPLVFSQLRTTHSLRHLTPRCGAKRLPSLAKT